MEKSFQLLSREEKLHLIKMHVSVSLLSLKSGVLDKALNAVSLEGAIQVIQNSLDEDKKQRPRMKF